MTDVVRNQIAADNEILIGSVGDYFALLKPRVMSLVVFTALVGMAVAPGGINPVIGFTALLAIAAGAGACGALNMWYDADIDRVMRRTAARPIPMQRIGAGEARGFGLLLAFGSVAILLILVNPISAVLLAFTIFFYVVVYTMWLKRTTAQNIVIGGAAGALPPVIGWAAATGTVGWPSLVLFLIIFLWTPPHFWALSLYKADDYRRAGIPMMPVVAGIAATKRQILGYSVVLAVAGLLPTLLGMASLAYGAIAGVLGALFVFLAWTVFRMPEADTDMRPARRLFPFSMFYLFMLFAVLLAEQGFTAAGFGP
jgi:protoheme IX farnesyltransferase